MSVHDDRFAELVAGHALDALEPHDEHELLLHLEHCADCGRQLREMREVAAAMAYDVEDSAPPPELLERIRVAMAAAPRDLPAADNQPVFPPTQAPVRHGDDLAARRARRRVTVSTKAASLVAAAAAVLALLGVGGYALNTRTDRNSTSSALSADQQVLAHLDRPGSYTLQLASGGAATGAAVVDGRDVYLVAHDLGSNDPHSSIYVLWAQDGHGQMVAVRGFDVGRGAATVVHATLPKSLDRPQQFGVTHEAGRELPATPGTAVLGTA